MEDKYSITIDNEITKIQFFENPSYELVKNIIDDLVEKDIYERRLWDLSKIDFNWSTDQLRSIAEYGKKVFSKPNKLALYAPKDLAFGEMRVFEVYREQHGHALPMVFRKEKEAIDWLNSPI